MRFNRRTRAILLAGAAGLFAAGNPLQTPIVAADAEYAPSVPGEFIVVLKPEGNAEVIAAAVGATLSSDSLLALDRTYLLALAPDVDVAATLNTLANTPGVESAQPNSLAQTADFLGLRKRFFSDLDVAVSATSASYSLSQPGLASANSVSELSGIGQSIAILDTGIDAGHPALFIRASGGTDFVDGDSNPSEAVNGIDDNGNGAIDEAFGHGTFVAGLAALVAPDAEILPVRVLDTDGSTDAWTLARGLAFARQAGADVINLSLGGPELGPVVESQIQAAHNAGIAIVAAAGNDASHVEQYPAAYSVVLSVGAVDGATGQPATFTNYGSWVDVAAPGVALTSTFPGGYASWGGTSASAPLVAGLLAGLLSENTQASPSVLSDAATSTAQQTAISISSYGQVNMLAAAQKIRESAGSPGEDED